MRPGPPSKGPAGGQPSPLLYPRRDQLPNLARCIAWSARRIRLSVVDVTDLATRPDRANRERVHISRSGTSRALL
ncbi:MAG: hypothetical protein ACYCR4_12125, partial [Acidimicrobiales bacterium]